MRELVTWAERQGHLESVLGDPEHPQWMAALKYATEYGYGKPTQSVAVSTEPRAPIVWRFGDREITF